jgi:hypothetical protein
MELSMEFHGKFHGIPIKKFMEKIRQMLMWNSMEFHEIS